MREQVYNDPNPKKFSTGTWHFYPGNFHFLKNKFVQPEDLPKQLNDYVKEKLSNSEPISTTLISYMLELDSIKTERS